MLRPLTEAARFRRVLHCLLGSPKRPRDLREQRGELLSSIYWRTRTAYSLATMDVMWRVLNREPIQPVWYGLRVNVVVYLPQSGSACPPFEIRRNSPYELVDPYYDATD